MAAARKKPAKRKSVGGTPVPPGAYAPPPPPEMFVNAPDDGLTPSGSSQNEVRSPSPQPSPQRGEGVPPSMSGDHRLTHIETSALSLHDLFARQAATMLKRADLDEEQKQAILIAMSCPCCGAGGLSITAKLKRRPSQKFGRRP